ncbi:MAG: hypothetical protein IPK77_11715 [Cellvibrio sp.]|nr:hypothetical protein [Cellvibrio sp.]
MKKIIALLLVFCCSVSALPDNPVAPPKADVVDRFGVNLQTGTLTRTLETVSVGGEFGLKHNVQLYTDLFFNGSYFGYVDAFAGSISSKKISDNIINILTNANGEVAAFRDTGSLQRDSTAILYVMRAYGPAGSQDFLVYRNGLVDYRNVSTSGYEYKSVGDTRHKLVESTDKKYLTWITPDGIETKYERSTLSGPWIAGTGAQLKEITYPNGYKVRVYDKAVSTNTGFMLKYQLNTQGLNSTPGQVVALNLAHQYCAVSAATCDTNSWPTATFAWPSGTPGVFRQTGLASSSYLVKMTTDAGVTDIQYQPENVCIKSSGAEDAACAASPPGGTKWYPRLRSIKTPEGRLPNYQYVYKNKGEMLEGGGSSTDGLAWGYTYWSLSSASGQITTATLNGTDSQGYSGPTVNSQNANLTWGNGEVWVVSSQYELNIIESVTDKKSGTYSYYKDLRHFVEKFYPIPGGGPAQQYFYNGPRGNLNEIKSIENPSNPVLLQEAEYSSGECIYPKTCNKPLRVKDARGNVTYYEYDPQGRFGSPTKITYSANEQGLRAATVYKYEPRYAYYKKDGEAITRDPDPIWMLTSEHTCRMSEATDNGCATGNSDMVQTVYYYGPQNGQANNLLQRGKSITAEGTPSIRVWCYEYDKYGKLIGETSPKGNSTSVQSCQ